MKDTEGCLPDAAPAWMGNETDISAPDISGLASVCLTLGPYRNLTTLTAGLLALHPHCQVLNHGGIRVFGNEELDFLSSYDDGRFNAFVRHALRASLSGERGAHGGSILYSHAFDYPGMKQAYIARYGDRVCKDRVKCLFWKESFRVTVYLRLHKVDIGGIFSRNKLLRFLMPVRNPLDCAVSNIKTGRVNQFEHAGEINSFNDVVESILREFLWFFDLQERHPGKFFHYYEHSFDARTASRMAEFLGLQADEQWLRDVVSNYRIKPGYQHDPAAVRFYREFVNAQFCAFPEAQKALLRFV